MGSSFGLTYEQFEMGMLHVELILNERQRSVLRDSRVAQAQPGKNGHRVFVVDDGCQDRQRLVLYEVYEEELDVGIAEAQLAWALAVLAWRDFVQLITGRNYGCFFAVALAQQHSARLRFAR